jgi:hypothetical protein
MSWTLDKGRKVWKCSEYSDLQYDEIVNFAEYGQPRNPYQPGFLEEDKFMPDFKHIVIEMPQAEVMTNGYGQNTGAENFPIVERFLKEKLSFSPGTYSFDDFVRMGFACSPDRTITDDLYGALLGKPVPGTILPNDAAFIYGTVSFSLMKSTRFTYTSQKREIRAEIGARDDNWDFKSSKVPNALNALLAATFGPDHYNLEAPIRINFVGPGKTSVVVRSSPMRTTSMSATRKR